MESRDNSAKARSAMEPLHTGQECWFARTAKDTSWEAGIVTTFTDQEVTLTLNDNSTIRTTRGLVYPKNDEQTVCSADLVTLHHLSRPAIVHTLTRRYAKNTIYTHSGSILIALNPYKQLSTLYNEAAMQKAHEGLGASEPHVYNIAERAYRALRRTGTSQSILVSGESGAGKTETTKHVLNYLSRIATESKHVSVSSVTPSSPSNSGSSGTGDAPISATTAPSGTAKVRIATSNKGTTIKEKVLASTPLLEALGNAKTVYNDNSSRFGKFISIFFSETGSIAGASLQTYLLERSRVVRPKPGERNFHIFYQLLRGLPKEKKEKYGISETVNTYKYLMGSEVESHDEADYKLTADALNKLGFTSEEQDAFYSAVSTVLALGNIEFKEGEKNEISIVNPRWLQLAAKLLNTDENGLRTALTQRMVVVTHSMTAAANSGPPGSVYISKHTKTKCEQSRDSFAMLLYSKLMLWVVRRINDILRPKISGPNVGNISSPNSNVSSSANSLPFIGVLDIYGFESFDRNGFEQLCINYANEKLQKQFNHQIFTRELEEYRAEGISSDAITYADNSPVIEAIEGTATIPGIVQHLDDQCKTNTGTDRAFLHSLLSGNVDKAVLKRPDRSAQDSFLLVHYADKVTYNIEGFVERNIDYVVEEHLGVLKRPECPFNRFFVGEEEQEKQTTESRGRAGSGAALQRASSFRNRGSGAGSGSSFVLSTVITRFRESLNGLMLMINATETHYIRCIKPNLKKHPDIVENDLIVRQLGCGGVFESVRVVMAGFPTRITHDNFLAHYATISLRRLHANNSMTATDKSIAIEEILQNALGTSTDANKTSTKQYRIGKTKVFLAAGIAARLDHRRVALNRSSILFQRLWRGYKQRKIYRRLRSLWNILAAACKGKHSRRLYTDMVAKKLIAPAVTPNVQANPVSVPASSPVSSPVSVVTATEDTVEEATRHTSGKRGAGWRSGTVSSILQERSVQYEQEIAALKKELEIMRLRDASREKELAKLEETCLSSLKGLCLKGAPPTELLGSDVARFDSVREELVRHYNTKIQQLSNELAEEREARKRDKATTQETIRTLREKNDQLTRDVEELRTKTEKAKAEHKEKKHLEARVKDLEGQLRTTTVATEKDPNKLDITTLQQTLSRISSTHSRQTDIVEALANFERALVTRKDYEELQKIITTHLQQQGQTLTNRYGAMEESMRETTTNILQIRTELARTMQMAASSRSSSTGTVEDRRMKEQSLEEQLQIIAQEFNAEEASATAILSALRTRITLATETQKAARQELIDRYEARIAALNMANAALTKKLETGIFDANNDKSN